jgi:hypothetical protein
MLYTDYVRKEILDLKYEISSKKEQFLISLRNEESLFELF